MYGVIRKSFLAVVYGTEHSKQKLFWTGNLKHPITYGWSFSYSDIVLRLNSWGEEDFANDAFILIWSAYRKRCNLKETLLRPLG